MKFVNQYDTKSENTLSEICGNAPIVNEKFEDGEFEKEFI